MAERSCFTCDHNDDGHCRVIVFGRYVADGKAIAAYFRAADTNGDGMPIDRTVACPLWAPPTTASDAQSVAAVTPAADESRDPAASEKHGGGGFSWAAEVEREALTERATRNTIEDDDEASARRFERATRPSNFDAGVRVYGDPYGDVRPWPRVAR